MRDRPTAAAGPRHHLHCNPATQGAAYPFAKHIITAPEPTLTDGGDGGDDLAQLQLVEDGGLTRSIESHLRQGDGPMLPSIDALRSRHPRRRGGNPHPTYHQDPHLLAGKELHRGDTRATVRELKTARSRSGASTAAVSPAISPLQYHVPD